MANHPISVIQLVCLLVMASSCLIDAQHLDSSDHFDFNADEDEPSVKLLDAASNGLMMQEALADRQNGCYWDGTAPICRGGCPSNYIEKYSDDCGDGKCCNSGQKKYCCPKPSNGCYWDGTAPICKGRCPNGFKQISSSKTGEGRRCVTGDKKFCCPI